MGKPKSIAAMIVVGALTASSTLTFAAPPVPTGPDAKPLAISVNEHHKKSQKNSSRPASSAPQSQRRKNNNDALAVGVGIAAVLGAIALSQQAQSRSDDGMWRECRRLRWKCREGRGWACRKYEDVCR